MVEYWITILPDPDESHPSDAVGPIKSEEEREQGIARLMAKGVPVERILNITHHSNGRIDVVPLDTHPRPAMARARPGIGGQVRNAG